MGCCEQIFLLGLPAELEEFAKRSATVLKICRPLDFTTGNHATYIRQRSSCGACLQKVAVSRRLRTQSCGQWQDAVTIYVGKK